MDQAALGVPESVAGRRAHSRSAGTVLQAGNHQALSVSFTPTDAADYTAAAATAVIKDRKSVASGKRVDLGGRRIIKKKSSAHLGATAIVPGTFTDTPAAGTVLQ